MIGYLEGQGLGRHSEAEIGRIAERGYAALARLIDDKPFLLGDRPCGADASIFAQIASALTPLFRSPVRSAVERHANLVAFSDRMMRQHYPTFA